ncbi:MAG: cupin domain-containing protein [Thermodesulfobacteriota bacterium]|nr:cupin domain-containing protein [Thermodesulfobacteriota bacterium]
MKHLHYPEMDSLDAAAVGLDGAEAVRFKLLSDDTVVLELAPGGHTPDHTHGDRERVIVMAGTGTVKSNQGLTFIQPADFIEFAPDEPHQIVNSGDDVLVLICFRNQGG